MSRWKTFPYEVIENFNKVYKFAGKVKIEVVPNLKHPYGRDVDIKLQEVFDDAIHDISATKIREKMREEGNYNGR